jgi:hypothetical protein
MQNKSLNDNFENPFLQEEVPPQKGQKIMYEGEEAEIIRVKPFPIIKTKTGVVCGVLNKQYKNIGEQK